MVVRFFIEILTFFVCAYVVVASFSSTGVPCYLHPSADGCHYKIQPDSDICTTPAQRQNLAAKIAIFNRTLVSLEHQLIRLGIIPPDNACSKLPPVENGGVIYDDLNLAPGATGRYTCFEGYTLVSFDENGRYEYTCTEDGIWDGAVTTVPVKCQLSSRTCDPPDDIENGTIIYLNDDPSSILVGDMITYTCLPGHDLEGDMERYCLRTGNWSGDIPFCLLHHENDTLPEEHSEGVRRPIVIGTATGSVLIAIFFLLFVSGVVCYCIKRRRKPKKENPNEGLVAQEDSSEVTNQSKLRSKAAYQVIKDVVTNKGGSGNITTTQSHHSYRSTHTPLLENEDENTF